MENECTICAERIDGLNRLQAVGVCNHLGVCSLCYLRLRSLIQSFSCPICKTELENVVCSPNLSITYQDFSIWGENAGAGMRYDHKSRMFFPSEYYTSQIVPLWSCKCTICDAWKRDTKTLSRHVSNDHENKYLMCSLCIEHKKVFPSEQKIFTQVEYENHLKNGGEGGFEGHPRCEFCKKRYYDKDALFFHLQKDHFTCHLCEKMGIRYRYYSDYDSLEGHFRKEHLLCEEPECLSKKFIVFADPIDHAAHMLNFHPNIQVSRAIPVQFRSRREEKFGSDIIDFAGPGGGGGFGRQNRSSHHKNSLEGGMGGRNVGGEWQVELPDAARDPREVIRDQQRNSASPENNESFGKTSGLEYRPEDYPALISEDSSNSNPLWTGKKGTQRSINDDFPALSSGNKGPVVTGWGGSVKVNTKLSVMKPRGQPIHQSSVPRHPTSGTKGTSVVGYHPPAPPPPPPSSKPPVAHQKDNKPAKNTSQAPPNRPSATVNENLNFEELTLAEKIKKEMSSKSVSSSPVVVNSSQPIRVPSPAAISSAVETSSTTHSSQPVIIDSLNDYPALPSSKKEKKSGKLPSSLASAGAQKNNKSTSGIYLAKPKFKGSQEAVEPTADNQPPPGFILLDNEPPPGFFPFSPPSSSSENKIQQSKPQGTTIATTETSNKKDFPGGWVSIGGSKGVQSQNENQVGAVLDDDFPTLSGPSGKSVPKSNPSNPSNQTKGKTKKQLQNELQSLAFKSK